MSLFEGELPQLKHRLTTSFDVVVKALSVRPRASTATEAAAVSIRDSGSTASPAYTCVSASAARLPTVAFVR
jgi:hypothetical protein